jgi:hypothetical protein
MIIQKYFLFEVFLLCLFGTAVGLCLFYGVGDLRRADLCQTTVGVLIDMYISKDHSFTENDYVIHYYYQLPVNSSKQNRTCTLDSYGRYDYYSEAADEVNGTAIGTQRKLWIDNIDSDCCYDQQWLRHFYQTGTAFVILGGAFTLAFTALLFRMCRESALGKREDIPVPPFDIELGEVDVGLK